MFGFETGLKSFFNRRSKLCRCNFHSVVVLSSYDGVGRRPSSYCNCHLDAMVQTKLAGVEPKTNRCCNGSSKSHIHALSVDRFSIPGCGRREGSGGYGYNGGGYGGGVTVVRVEATMVAIVVDLATRVVNVVVVVPLTLARGIRA
ncbi:hypothetical protein LguiB_003138 [Lonicera macranthoides]